jgi:tRNA/tmRNA/rRNA uracil-C5-methylase (TrmA/RlmC/RlmD family)
MNNEQIFNKIAEFQNNPAVMAFVVSEAIAKAAGDESKVDAYIAAGLVGVCLAWLDDN